MASQNKYSCPRLKKFVLLASKEDNKGTFLSLPYALRFVALSVGKVWRSSLKRELNSLKKFIPLENGVPLHDIVRGVFEQLNPKQQLVFKELVKFLNSETEGKFVAIVGKILIGTLNAVSGIAIIHTLSAWASESRLVLGGCDVDRKENEIAKIPYLLGMLEIKKAVVTIDAMGCQKNIAKLIVTKNKADYVLLSKNQKELYEEVTALFKLARTHQEIQADFWESLEKGHGRIEKKTCACISAAPWLEHVPGGWTKLDAVAKSAPLMKKSKSISETRYVIFSLPPDAEKSSGQSVNTGGSKRRSTGGLDVACHEGACIIKKDTPLKNLAILRRIGFNPVKPRPPEGMTTNKAQPGSILSQIFSGRHFIKIWMRRP